MTQEDINKLSAAISRKLMICSKEILTSEEAAQYLGITKSALYKMTHNRQIPFSKPNGKNCFFKRAELEAWLMSNPVATNDELNARVRAYCMKK